MRKQLAILLLLLLPLVLPAQTVVEDDVTCGQRVRVTATPKLGYHFVEWSDGVTDNPRWIDIEADSAIVAYFAPNCKRPIVPIIPMYNWMLMLDKPALNQMGFNPAEDEVVWYRVANERDDIGAAKRDDELVHVGYFLTSSHVGTTAGKYYAEIVVNAPDSFLLCSDTIRSNSWTFEGIEAIYNVTGNNYTCRHADGYVYLSGLPIGQESDITMFDATGRCVMRYRSKEETFFFEAPPAGCYIIQISNRSGTVGIRYIQY